MSISLSPIRLFRIASTALLVSGTVYAHAQGRLVDKRDQADGWYLPVLGEVTVEGQRSNDFEVTVFRDNEELGKIKADKKGRFKLELDIDRGYTLMVTKPGYQRKIIYLDTSLPQELVTYPEYMCFVNLIPENATNIDPFYTDFPSAIVRYDADQGGFYHSENYLTHIQTKLTGYAKAGQ